MVVWFTDHPDSSRRRDCGLKGERRRQRADVSAIPTELSPAIFSSSTSCAEFQNLKSLASPIAVFHQEKGPLTKPVIGVRGDGLRLPSTHNYGVARDILQEAVMRPWDATVLDSPINFFWHSRIRGCQALCASTAISVLLAACSDLSCSVVADPPFTSICEAVRARVSRMHELAGRRGGGYSSTRMPAPEPMTTEDISTISSLSSRFPIWLTLEPQEAFYEDICVIDAVPPFCSRGSYNLR